MTHLQTRFLPQFEVEFTEDDVLQLELFSQRHYDPRCQSLSNKGGLIYGFKNHISMNENAKITVDLSCSDVDLLCKVLEYNTMNKYEGNLLSQQLRVLLSTQTLRKPVKSSPER